MGLTHTINRSPVQPPRPTIIMTEPFPCTAGFNFTVADANGDVFLCSNFMRGENSLKLGNLYQGIALRDTLFPCAESFCVCPQYKFDPKLRTKALKPHGWTAWRLPYDVWVHWYVTEECFLSCVYCEAGNRPFLKRQVKPIDIPALMRTLDGLDRRVHLSFTGGGEPFAVPNMTEACAAITRKHYISFNSNLLGIRMEEFLPAIDVKRLLYIQGSVHLAELERTRNIARFIRNAKALRQAGVKLNLVAVGIPSIIPDIPRFRATFAAEAIDFTFAPFSGLYDGKRYPDSYTDEDLDALGLSEQAAKTHLVGSEAPHLAGRLIERLRHGLERRRADR